MRALWLALAVGGAVACGGTDSTVVDGGGGDGGPGGDATTGNDGGNPGNDGGTGNDGGNPGNDSGTVLNDAGNPATVPCGTSSCSGGQVCCVDTNTQTPTFTCAASCPQNTTTLKCVGNDCGSQVCCVFIDQNNQTASQCQASCTTNQAQLCQDTDAGPTGCSQNAPCSSQNIADWGLNPPFGTCGGIGN